MTASSEGLLGALAEGLDFKALAEAGAEDAAAALLPGSRFAVVLSTAAAQQRDGQHADGQQFGHRVLSPARRIRARSVSPSILSPRAGSR